MALKEDLIKNYLSLQRQLSDRDLQTNGLTTLTEEALEKFSLQKLALSIRTLEEVIDSKKPKTITVKPEYKKFLDDLDVDSLLHKHEKKEDNGKEL